MQSNLSNSLASLVVLLIIGCSTSPPELPPDYGSNNPTHIIDETLFSVDDLAKTCDEIHVEYEQLGKMLHTINKGIEDNRASDQALAYLFGAVTMIFDTNSDIKEKRIMIKGRQDNLSLLRRYKKC